MLASITRRAIIIFLLLTILGTAVFLFAAQYFLAHLASGLDRAIIRQLLLLLAMFIPAASAILVQRLLFHRPVHDLGWRLGPLRLYLQSYATIALGFIINYGLTWAFIIPTNWTLANFLDSYAPSLPLPTPLLIIIVPLLTFILAPIINMIPALGEEIGWRGFLLPALAPLGTVRAIAISSTLWALWHLAIISLLGFASVTATWPAVALSFFMLLAFGLWLSYVWLKTTSTILTAFMHATFNAGSYAFWLLIFATGSKLLIRSAGLAGFIVLLIFGLVGLYFLVRRLKLGFKL